MVEVILIVTEVCTAREFCIVTCTCLLGNHKVIVRGVKKLWAVLEKKSVVV